MGVRQVDCLQAAEIVAGAFDGELTDAAVLAEARVHCASCPQCASLLLVLERAGNVPAPRAPEELIARIEASAVEAAADAREASDAHGQADSPHEHITPVGNRRPWSWTPRLVAFASAAAVLLIVFTASTIALVGGQRATDEAATTLTEESASTPLAAPEAGVAQDSTEMRAAEQPAPPYVVLGQAVYVQGDAPAPSTLTTAGTVTSDLGTGTPTSHAAFVEPGTDDPIFIAAPEGGYLSFSLVTRTLGRASYALISDVPIESYGQWPTLRSDMAQPTSEDGSPVFRRFGFDDRGVDVYTPTPARVDGGFAVAPGTAEDDPASGNPNWTWWEPVR